LIAVWFDRCDIASLNRGRPTFTTKRSNWQRISFSVRGWKIQRLSASTRRPLSTLHLVRIGKRTTAGSVRIIAEQPDTKAIDITTAVIGADAKECKGKFASGRSGDMVDSEVLFRGFSSREDSAGNRYVEYFVLPRKKGGFALFSIVAAPSYPPAAIAFLPRTRANSPHLRLASPHPPNRKLVL
jgi:hypothetical protein